MSQRVHILLSLYRLTLRVPVEVRVDFFTGFLEARASHLQALSRCMPAGAEVGEACLVRALLALIVHQDELLHKRLAQAQSRLLLLLAQKGPLGGGQTRGYA